MWDRRKLIVLLMLLCFSRLSSVAFAEEVAPAQPAKITRVLEGEKPANKEAARKAMINEIVGNLFENLLKKKAEKPQARPVIRGAVPVQPGVGNLQKFLQPLEHALTLEIHYLRKVCDPTEKQLKPIRAAGNEKIQEMAKLVAKNEHGAFRNQDQGGRELLVEALQEAARAHLSEADYRKYARELDQRREAQAKGVAGFMTQVVDHWVALSPAQQNLTIEHLTDKGDPSWTNNIQVFFYPQYCPLPSLSLMEPILNQRQRKAWLPIAQDRTRSSISFGWPRNIGLEMFGRGLEFEELEDYSSVAGGANE